MDAPIAGQATAITPPLTDAVCVIIAARNAAKTIAAAITSALREPQVGEIVVVDDGSTDDTADAARSADDGSGRLKIIRLKENRGPSHARNTAIEQSSSGIISILDADDFFVPGRFAALMATDDWDIAADNIVFVDSAMAAAFDADALKAFRPDRRALSALHFIERNISKPGKSRGELGFLKPVIRRAFLQTHGLRYDEDLRLGEDFDLYLRALLKGARFQIISNCGYGAVVRGDSLSASHRTEDLRQLMLADRRVLATMRDGAEKNALGRHEKHIRARFLHRKILDVKKEGGMGAVLSYCLKAPSAILPAARGIILDKLRAASAGNSAATQVAPLPRYLFPETLE